MGERPIIFNREMVRAILDGRKTQTRRMVKSEIPDWATHAELHEDGWFFHDGDEDREDLKFFPDYDSNGFQCPFGEVGDRLWVRESFFDITPSCTRAAGGPLSCWYKADVDEGNNIPKWTPSIHMPRWASRITLEITNVRVERLQDISEGDARKEGVKAIFLGHNDPEGDNYANKCAFKDLWDSIYKNWNENPWVWVIEFKKIDEVLK